MLELINFRHPLLKITSKEKKLQNIFTFTDEKIFNFSFTRLYMFVIADVLIRSYDNGAPFPKSPSSEKWSKIPNIVSEKWHSIVS